MNCTIFLKKKLKKQNQISNIKYNLNRIKNNLRKEFRINELENYFKGWRKDYENFKEKYFEENKRNFKNYLLEKNNQDREPENLENLIVSEDKISAGKTITKRKSFFKSVKRLFYFCYNSICLEESILLDKFKKEKVVQKNNSKRDWHREDFW